MDKKEEKLAPKHIVWMVVAGFTAAAVTLIAIFGDANAQAWVKDLLIFGAGLAIPGSPLGGLVRRAAPVALTMLALSVLVASGCSASALRSHRMALGLTDIALGAGNEILSTVGAEVVEACAGDESCLSERKGAIADAEAAFTLADAARGAYATAIDVAREVGEGDFLSAVGMGARGLLRAYYFVRAALCRLGRELPEPPRLLVQLVTWASREELGDVPECVLPVSM